MTGSAKLAERRRREEKKKPDARRLKVGGHRRWASRGARSDGPVSYITPPLEASAAPSTAAGTANARSSTYRQATPRHAARREHKLHTSQRYVYPKDSRHAKSMSRANERCAGKPKARFQGIQRRNQRLTPIYLRRSFPNRRDRGQDASTEELRSSRGRKGAVAVVA